MHVAEYGFTLKRVLASRFEIAILITLVIGAIKLYKHRLRYRLNAYETPYGNGCCRVMAAVSAQPNDFDILSLIM